MSYPIAPPITLPPKTASGSYTADMTKFDVSTNNDIAYLMVSCSATSGTLSVSGTGWTEVVELDVATGCRMAAYRCTVSGGTVADPTFSLSAGTGLWEVSGWVERDNDTTTPVDSATETVDPGAGVSSATSKTYTPSVDNCRIVYFATGRASGSAAQLRMLAGDGVTADVLQDFDDGSTFISQAVGSTVQGTAAATAKTFYASGTGKRIGIITLALRNATSGKRAKSATAGLSRVAWCGNFGNTHDGTLTPTVSSWGTPTSRTIGAYSVNATVATRSTDVTGPVSWGSFDRLTTTTISESWQGGMCTFAADIDMTGKFFTMEFFSPFAAFGNEGALVVFEDNAGTNWAAFQLSAKLGWVANQLYTAIIDIENSTPYASEAGTGTASALNWANVRKISLLVHWSSTNRQLNYRHFGLLSSTTLVGGNSVTPLTINFLRQALHGWAYTGLVGGEYPAATLHSSVQIGDGSTATYYDATGTLTTFSDPYDALLQRFVNVGANRISVTTYASASDTINWTATSVSAPGLEQNFVIHASSSTSATYSFSGCTDVGTVTSLQPGITYTGLTLSSSRLQLAAAGTYTFTTVTATRLDFTPTAASTYVLGSGTFSGQLDLRNTSATYAITVELPSGTSYTTGNNTGAAITVTLPTVTADISITSIPTAVGADRRLQIINTTASAASAWASATAYSAGDVVLRTTGVGSESTAGLYMRCTTAGTSGGTEPTWDTTVGNTTTDNTVTWTTYSVLFYDADPGASSYSTTYVDGEEFLAGEEVAIRCAEMDGSTSFKTYSTAVIAATTGFSALVSEESDTVFATYALDGSAYDTTFSPNYVANYIVLDTNTDFSGASAYAYYCWLLTTSDGMYRFWGGLTALDTGNIRNNDSVISLYFDESAGFVKQTDSVRIFRNDGARPAIDPTTGGNGIEINWRVPVNVVSTGGSALTTEEHDQLMSRPSTTNIWSDSKALTVPKFIALK